MLKALHTGRAFAGGLMVGAVGTLLYVSRSASGDAETDRASATASATDPLLRHGTPQTHAVRRMTGYASSTSYRHRTPLWVVERLTRDALAAAQVERDGVQFTADEDLPPADMQRASNEDYWGSGWSRGHMAPAGNHKQSREAMVDTFRLGSNIVPQDLDNNMHFWNRLEKFVRSIVMDEGSAFDEVHVVSGPLWLPEGVVGVDGVVQQMVELSTTVETSSETSSSGSELTLPFRRPRPDVKDVHYKVIGANQVAVPTHLYKVILAERPHDDSDAHIRGAHYLAAAFVIPNAPIPEETPLTAFQVPLDMLQSWAGIHFFPKLGGGESSGDDVSDSEYGSDARASTPVSSKSTSTPPPIVDDLCKCIPCIMIDARQHRASQLIRTIRSSRSRWYLDKAFRDLTEMGEPFLTEDVRALYEMRAAELDAVRAARVAQEAEKISETESASASSAPTANSPNDSTATPAASITGASERPGR